MIGPDDETPFLPGSAATEGQGTPRFQVRAGRSTGGRCGGCDGRRLRASTVAGVSRGRRRCGVRCGSAGHGGNDSRAGNPRWRTGAALRRSATTPTRLTGIVDSMAELGPGRATGREHSSRPVAGLSCLSVAETARKRISADYPRSHRWLAPPLQDHCPSVAPFAVEDAKISRHSPLATFRNVTPPKGDVVLVQR